MGEESAHRPIRRNDVADHQWSPIGTVAILLALLLTGCDGSIPIPANLRTPTIVGVVEDIVRQPDGGKKYELTNGTSAGVGSHADVLLGGEPLVGELLLAGTDPDGRQWVAGISGDWPGRPAGCFLFPAQGRANDGWIETSAGFRFPKAADFTDATDHPTGEFGSDRGAFCLNDMGKVTSYASV